jgi:hypothetical protein
MQEQRVRCAAQRALKYHLAATDNANLRGCAFAPMLPFD